MGKKQFSFGTPDTITKVWIVACAVLAFAFGIVYVYRIVTKPVESGIVPDAVDTRIGAGGVNPKAKAVAEDYEARQNRWLNDPVIE